MILIFGTVRPWHSLLTLLTLDKNNDDKQLDIEILCISYICCLVLCELC